MLYHALVAASPFAVILLVVLLLAAIGASEYQASNPPTYHGFDGKGGHKGKVKRDE